MDTQQLTSQRTGYVSGEFLTHRYRISAEVNTRGGRLLDELNDMALFVQVERAFISPLHDPAILVASSHTAQIRKDSLALAVLKASRDGLPAREGQYVGRDHVARHVQVMVGGFEVNGVIRLHPSVDVGHFVRTTTEHFIPLFDATAIFAAQRAVTFSGGAVLINRALIELFFVSER